MNEAPKILWYDDQECSAGPVKFNSDEVKYVRADLVDGLVEALELLVSYGNVFSYKAGQESPYEIARAALKALESAEIGRGIR
jgi:hypothetical protein